MPVRRLFAAAFALLALLASGVLFVGVGCGKREGDGLPSEMDEPLFVQGVQLRKQEKKSEALTCFLKVIEKRGDRASAESHLEAGALYLHHAKDPVEAYHHFRKYLELQPNSRQAPYVRGMVDAAKREFYKTLAAPPQGDPPSRPSDHAVRLAMDEEVEKLRRENSELRAELQTLRGGGAAAVARQAKMISLPPETRAGPASPTTARATTEASVVPAPRAATPSVSIPVSAPPAKTSTQTAKTPAASTKTPATRAGAPATSGRTHTVQPKQTLYAIARQYNVKMEDLAKANGISNPASVPAGTVLRIP